jgi:putative protease
MSRERPYNRGILLGKVESYDRKYRTIKIKLNDELELGDGIGFEDNKDAGTIVQRMYCNEKVVQKAGKNELVTIPFEEEIKKGSIVYRTQDSSLMKELQSSYEQGNLRKISVYIRARAIKDEYFEIIMRDEDGNESRVVSDYRVEPSQKRASEKSDIIKQLEKLGNTAFDPKNINIQMEDEIFLPIRTMNDARNEAVSILEEMRVEKYRRNKHSPYLHPKNTASSELTLSKPLLAVSVNNPNKIQAAISGGADVIYYDLQSYNSNENEFANIQEAADVSTVPLYLHSPHILKNTEMDEFEKLILHAKEAGFAGVIAGNLGTFRKCTRIGIAAIADSNLNIFNRETATIFSEKGSELVILSPEMNSEQIKELGQEIETEYIVHGKLQVMESEHDLISGLQIERRTEVKQDYELVDEKGFAFQLKMDSMHRTHLFNSKELCLLEDIEELVRTGVSRLRIDARSMKYLDVEKVTRSYRQSIDKCFEPTGTRRLRCKDISIEYTRGHFHRGVL